MNVCIRFILLFIIPFIFQAYTVDRMKQHNIKIIQDDTVREEIPFGGGVATVSLADKKTVMESERDLCYERKERGGHVGGKVDNNIIIAGGTNWSKDKTTKYWLSNSIIFQDGKWKLGPDLPKPITYAMFAYDSSGIYLAGGTIDGRSVSNDVYKLVSLKKGKDWETLSKLPVRLGYGSGIIFDDKFYIACGSNGMQMSNKVWVLNIRDSQSKWIPCESVPGVGRMFPSLVSCGKYLYLLGGLAKTAPLTPLKDAYRYDAGKNQWKQLNDLPLKGYAWVSQPVDDNHLIITGRAYGKVDKSIWVIDLRDMSMKKIGDNIEVGS